MRISPSREPGAAKASASAARAEWAAARAAEPAAAVAGSGRVPVPASVGRRGLLWLLPAALVVAGTLGANRDAVPSAEQDEAALRAAVGAVPAAAAVLVALRVPRVAIALTGLAVGGYVTADLQDGPIYLSVPLVAYLAARRARPRLLLPWLVGLAAALVAGSSARVVLHDVPGWASFWQAVGLTAALVAAALLGWWTASRREVRAERIRRAGAEEQLRMAQDLHDGVGHGLAVIAMQAGVALHLLDRMIAEPGTPAGGAVPPVQIRRSLELIRQTSTEALDALRAELARIAPEPEPEDGSSGRLPVVRTPRRGLADLPALVERVRSTGLRIELTGAPVGLSEAEAEAEAEAGGAEAGRSLAPGGDLDAAAFAIVQESLTNVLRHAQAERVGVDLHADGETLVVTVTDDGAAAGSPEERRGEEAGPTAVTGPTAGPEPADRSRTAGRGIAGMRSRATALGGVLEAGPLPGGGWRVRAVLPVRGGGRRAEGGQVVTDVNEGTEAGQG